MSAVCPAGHVSATTDYCDQCGAPIDVAARPGPDGTMVVDEVDTSAAARQQPCPACRAPRCGDDRFCEGCGYDFVAAPPVAAPTPGGEPGAAWEVVAEADRRQFERHPGAGVEFPTAYPPRSFRLEHDQVRIGRSRSGPGAPVPEIDLAGTPQDPGISHLHAVLERGAGGSYTVRDLGSTNGTTLNDDPVSAEVAVPVADGDRIGLGAWTTITVRGG
jgi:hypothetical protein